MMSVLKTAFTAALIATAACAAGNACAADADKTPGSGPSPYTDCGIGAALFHDIPWAAVTSNVIWDLGSTAITSATASPQTCSAKKVQAALFIGHTYERLAEEAAAGSGEHLSTALSLFECSGDQQAAAIAQLRGPLGKAVSATGYMDGTPIQKAAGLYSIMESTAAVHCGA